MDEPGNSTVTAERPPLVAFDDALLAALEPVRAQLAALEAESALLEARLRELRAARGRLTKALALLDPGSAPAKVAPGKAKRRRTPLVSSGRQDRILAYLRERYPEEAFAIADVAQGLGVGKTVARRAIEALLESGQLRLDGYRPGPGRAAKLYRVL